MPLPITLAHRITRRLAAVRKSGELSYLRPDGKAQVTVEYENGKPVRINTVVLSTQHDEDIDPCNAPPGYDRAGHQALHPHRNAGR